VDTTTTTCQINCDTQAMTCRNFCLPTTAATAASPAAAATSGTCNLNCTTQLSSLFANSGASRSNARKQGTSCRIIGGGTGLGLQRGYRAAGARRGEAVGR
jgi:hypothetical protein